MVYLYCEDDKGGFHLIHLLDAIYFGKKLVVRSLKGIYKLGRKIEDIAHMTGKSDYAVIIYDNSPGNKCVKNELELAYERIKELKIDNVYFIPIIW